MSDQLHISAALSQKKIFLLAGMGNWEKIGKYPFRLPGTELTIPR